MQFSFTTCISGFSERFCIKGHGFLLLYAAWVYRSCSSKLAWKLQMMSLLARFLTALNGQRKWSCRSHGRKCSNSTFTSIVGITVFLLSNCVTSAYRPGPLYSVYLVYQLVEFVRLFCTHAHTRLFDAIYKRDCSIGVSFFGKVETERHKLGSKRMMTFVVKKEAGNRLFEAFSALLRIFSVIKKRSIVLLTFLVLLLSLDA